MKNIIATTIISLGFLLSAGNSTAQNANHVYSYPVGTSIINLLAESQGQGNKGILIGATDEMIAACAPEGTFPNAMNAFLVQMPSQTVLVDAGLGRELFNNLESLGVSPSQIDIILLTHMHGDHTGGLLREGVVMFPNAKLYLSQPEYDYWMGDEKFKQQQQIIAAYKDQLHLFQPCELGKSTTDLVPGLTAYAAYGHTPGHTIYMLESGGEKLLVWGDLTHAMALQMPYPQVAVTYDVNPDDAIAARKQVLEYVSKYNIPIAGMHVAYPAMGSIKRQASGGYSFIPF
ncbi:glyoxylase-like metal-dependent hydrolase (beta-lactamase superfamily II) [Parabacteroides sp. PF5-5]|uniref:MBL fold metallo-hydrolase n=1 Tax=unclassified Parabacteroides TaxID=2649774 RepID=UPI002473682D|nr:MULTISPECIES: MBL fold metallo-hydrolase [unclassified Parabacteroides]MDH6306912.1 glyoxylase-like metal-dependent hydrolase (beta-lactamase superfamily II) [Parabacteroides sp. PH5-39]MDH6317700.1 glyoxylase-like metal-dependent hydrolase (beta-lactamase superfamily II) [Parabacteroides sp. PF5-13]MDH6321713.1 glyoxylase-like metal-dependent hydrolase (beta-lactamase superfamily II) [Parabacteroides sp. PH5-13]MDH6325299.1 glyoxylase-like metal-dependent hydrolase (beta-lactamase superfami